MPKFTNGHAKAGGRRKGSPNKGTERARRLISEADDKAIVDRVVREAKDNTNPESARLYFRYLQHNERHESDAADPVGDEHDMQMRGLLRRRRSLERPAFRSTRILRS